MYQIDLPNYMSISGERKEYLKNNANALLNKYKLIKYIDEEYYPREKIKYLECPKEFKNSEELYFTISYLRKWNTTPVKNLKWEYFTLNIPPFVQKILSDLDRKGVESSAWMSFTQSEKIYLSNEWIIEEAISSSQIEWAQTTANIAKDIIIKNKEPKNKYETMIVNNYKTMLFIRNEINDAILSEQLLLDLQAMLTKNTLEDPQKCWRFRNDNDNIIIMNWVSWDVYHIPPKEDIMKNEIKSLIDFANDKDEIFIHPFVKATILHFWIWYLHPFCDWNWRTARAIFYRYLNKKWYTDFTYIPISRVINNSKKQYWMSYIYSEQENNDLTFFLVYIAQKTQQAFEEYRKFIIKQKEYNQNIQKMILSLYKKSLNERQISLVYYFIENPDKYTNITMYKNQYLVSPNTAKTDIYWLRDIWLLQSRHIWNFINYYPTNKLLNLRRTFKDIK